MGLFLLLLLIIYNFLLFLTIQKIYQISYIIGIIQCIIAKKDKLL
jgi:hypothetical protein